MRLYTYTHAQTLLISLPDTYGTHTYPPPNQLSTQPIIHRPIQTLPHTAPPALAAAAGAVRSEYEALELLMFDVKEEGQGSSSSSSSSSEEEDEGEEEGEEGEEGAGSRAPSPAPPEGGTAGVGKGGSANSNSSSNNNKRKGAAKRRVKTRRGKGGSVEGERRRRICALHGCGAALALLLKGAARVRVYWGFLCVSYRGGEAYHSFASSSSY